MVTWKTGFLAAAVIVICCLSESPATAQDQLPYFETSIGAQDRQQKKTIKRQARREFRRQRRQAKKLAQQMRTLRTAANKEARRVCRQQGCDWRQLRNQLYIDKTFVNKVFRSTTVPLGVDCAAPNRLCPANPQAGVAPDCCTPNQDCNYINPPIGAPAARCTDNRASCQGSYCDTANKERWAAQLSNCCAEPYTCEVLSVPYGKPITLGRLNVPTCVSPKNEPCPPSHPKSGTLKVGRQTVVICCRANEKPATHNGVPYCHPDSCPAPEKICSGNPPQCCDKDETCAPAERGPANCHPGPTAAPTATATPVTGPTAAPSSYPTANPSTSSPAGPPPAASPSSTVSPSPPISDPY